MGLWPFAEFDGDRSSAEISRVLLNLCPAANGDENWVGTGITPIRSEVILYYIMANIARHVEQLSGRPTIVWEFFTTT
jgi:hypothetical protein